MRCADASARFQVPLASHEFLSLARASREGPGIGIVMTRQALVQSWFLIEASNSQLSFSCVCETLFFNKKAPIVYWAGGAPGRKGCRGKTEDTLKSRCEVRICVFSKEV